MGKAARLKRERSPKADRSREARAEAPDDLVRQFTETAKRAVEAIRRGEDAEWPALAFYDSHNRLEYYLTLDPQTLEQVKVRSQHELRNLVDGVS